MEGPLSLRRGCDVLCCMLVCALVVGFENLSVLFSTYSYVISIGFSFLEFKFKFEI
jgi:hypothetical protein